jgi:ABC-type branched-subunit amino acid transport system ATPase component
MGLGRTFQRVQLWNALTVRENVALGREGSMAGGNPLKQLRATRAERDEVETAVDAALGLCGIGWLQHHEVAGLTTGQRRLVELARCLAGPYDLLLLDEPSSGLDSTESRRFGQVLQQVVRERGTGILLVEHDMQLVMDVCQHIYVLDVGQLIFQGTPAEVQASELVRAAYLGSSDVELGVAGT